jgi:malate synthase
MTARTTSTACKSPPPAPLHRGAGAARHRRRRRRFWQGFDAIVASWRRRTPRCWPSATGCRPSSTLAPQAPGPVKNRRKYRAFLSKIGYLVPVPKDVRATTKNVDAELALQAGPQLVVADHERALRTERRECALGLALRRALWHRRAARDDGAATRAAATTRCAAAKVIEYARHVLDRTAPLARGSHLDSTGYAVKAGALVVTLSDGTRTGLATPAQFVGYQGAAGAPSSVLLSTTACTWTAHRPQHADRRRRPGRRRRPPCSNRRCRRSSIAGDSVAVVDADDKVLATATGSAS